MGETTMTDAPRAVEHVEAMVATRTPLTSRSTTVELCHVLSGRESSKSPPARRIVFNYLPQSSS